MIDIKIEQIIAAEHTNGRDEWDEAAEHTAKRIAELIRATE